MGNIFVSEKDPMEIVGLLDWQPRTILPLFLQVRFPIFLEPPENFSRGLHLPKVPDDFNKLDSEDKNIALAEKEQAMRAKAYELSTFRQDREAFEALQVPDVLRQLYHRCGSTHDDGIIPLRECLIEISNTCERLGIPAPLPYSFTDEELSIHEEEFDEYRKWHDVQVLVQRALETDAEGWISPEVDWDKTRTQNRTLLDLFVKKMALDKAPEEAKRMWPFPEE